ncbi:DNA cytosine methyltransferase [Actinomyces sp.]|uniref:DNA cytosine methyltransferase n=1 Tax=Actinomyces sp. TaxID=29317 RepID=UPI0026DCD87F|nr:DNA cytosine methyltransferase [Actinomyces sp.]MDO4900121.1 DNA cytosine methyltransferase [Actinomyces sp.]
MSDGDRLSAISLFSGAGGMDIGFSAAGIDAVLANEIDPDAADAYISNPKYLNPDAMCRGDVYDLLDSIGEYRGVDVVYGGPPCQGFSVAGKMNPDDERSRLIWAFMDVIRKTGPRLFVMENVKALGTLTKWEAVRAELVGRAEVLGYGHASLILNASDFGVPQARERFFFVGVQGVDSESVRSDLTKALDFRRVPGKTVREALRAVPRLGTSGNTEASTAQLRLAKNPILRRSPYDGSLLFNGRGRPTRVDAVAKTLPAQMGGNHTPIIDQALLENPLGFDWVADYHSKLIAGAITPQEAERSIPGSLRRLSVAEAAALQTFPADYHFAGRQNKQYRQIGNAVPCRLAQALAESTVESLMDLAH